jgi:hypothetical protein
MSSGLWGDGRVDSGERLVTYCSRSLRQMGRFTSLMLAISVVSFKHQQNKDQ